MASVAAINGHAVVITHARVRRVSSDIFAWEQLNPHSINSSESTIKQRDKYIDNLGNKQLLRKKMYMICFAISFLKESSRVLCYLRNYIIFHLDNKGSPEIQFFFTIPCRNLADYS